LTAINPPFLKEPDDVFQAVAAVSIAEIAEMDHTLTTLNHEDVDCFFGGFEVSMTVRK